MANRSPDPVERLRDVLIGGAESASPAEVEGCYRVVEEEALALVHGGRRGRLDELWSRLRDVYEILAADSAEDYQRNPLYHLGRVVELVELLAVAGEHAHPAEVTALLEQEGCRKLLAKLRDGPLKSFEIEALLKLKKHQVSRRVKRLGELGLVISRYSGINLISQITPLGEEALRD